MNGWLELNEFCYYIFFLQIALSRYLIVGILKREVKKAFLLLVILSLKKKIKKNWIFKNDMNDLETSYWVIFRYLKCENRELFT